jgi:photosystem II stability/assembly factor-like uncharacterized protein
MKRKFILSICIWMFAIVTLVLSQEWQSCNSGLPNLSARTIVASGNSLYLSLLKNGIYVSNDNGVSWSSKSSEIDGKYLNKIAIADSSIYVTTINAGLLFSSNLGKTWTTIGQFTDELTDIKILGDTIFLGSAAGFFKSVNKGTDWVQINSGLKSDIILALGFLGNNILAGSFTEGFYSKAKNGNEWVQLNEGLTYKRVYDIAVDGENIFLSTCNENNKSKGSVFVSTNSGLSWKDIDPTSQQERYFSIFYYDNKVFAGGMGKIFVWKKTDNSWDEISTGLPKNAVTSLTVLDNYLYAAIQNSGVYRFDLLALDVRDSRPCELLSLTPNPADDFLTVNLKPSEGFEPSEGSEIQIYNTLGEKVMAVGNNDRCSVQINISALPKGMYFVKVAGETAKFLKM